MSFAEVVLRLGCLLVGWLLVFVHGLVLAVIPSLDCASAGDPWLAGLVLAVPTFGVPFMLPYGAGLEELRATLRWLALPYAGLLLLAVRPVLVAFGAVTLDAAPLCAAATKPILLDAEWLARAWAPLQLVLLAALASTIWRFFRGPGSERA